MPYCGCSTKSSRIRWAVVTGLGILGVGLIVGSVIEVTKCKVCDSEGNCGGRGFSYENNNGEETFRNSEGTIVHEGRLEECSIPLFRALLIAGIISLIASSLPCCFNCCFAKPPDYNQDLKPITYAPYVHAAPGVPAYGTVAQPGVPQYGSPAVGAYNGPDAVPQPPPPGVPAGMAYSSKPAY